MIRLCTKESMSADIMQTHESQMSSWPKTSSYIVRFRSHVSIQVYAKVFYSLYVGKQMLQPVVSQV